MSAEKLIRSLRQEILQARRRIYSIGEATPLQTIHTESGLTLHVKREDISPIHAYKWRGAYNRMAQLSPQELTRGVTTASAGNHAQGVALAAKHLNTHANIFMPLATPRMKQNAVRLLGGDHVTIQLQGDTYDAASNAAHAHAATNNTPYIHAYDDLAVMAGQGTLADEIVLSGKGPFDIAFLQIGGGGMAAATATWLKLNYPDIHIIGVEGINQASMQAAIQAGQPVPLDTVDIFCDGTAVRQVGKLTHQVCAEVIDEWMTVTNDEVAAAIQFLWENLRAIPEPSGAMGVAAALKRQIELQGKSALTILCGANMDFEQLAIIARRSAVGAARRYSLRIQIPEKAGAMAQLLADLPQGTSIVDFQYGKTHAQNAAPIIGFETSPLELIALKAALEQHQYTYQEVSDEVDVRFRFIPFKSQQLRHPHFITLEFHERPGALADFLQQVSPHSNLGYFNYIYSGERVGRALLGFEFDTPTQSQNFPTILKNAAHTYRTYQTISPEALARILA